MCSHAAIRVFQNILTKFDTPTFFDTTTNVSPGRLDRISFIITTHLTTYFENRNIFSTEIPVY